MAADPKPPTSEIGKVNQNAGGFAGSATSWSTFIDEREYAAKLKWPQSFDRIERMLTDSQIEGLMLGCTLPIRRFRWYIDPQDARPEVAEGVAKDFGLPLKGQTDFKRGRRKGRFSHDRHLTDALRALAYGFYYFEQYGEIGEDDLWHLRKFAPRSPRTLLNGQINVAEDGGLVSIVQNTGIAPKPIPVNRLLCYVWDQEAGNWVGRSMLRSCYRPWLAKDLAFRVAPLNIERNGMGVPVIEAPPGATDEQIEALGAMAQQYRSGDRAGGAVPSGAKLTLQGVQGTIPDSVGFMRFCNEEMAKGFLQLFANLGQSDTGSHSLAEDFIGLFSYALESVAGWYADTTTEHGIEDWVDWNYGTDEEAPALCYERSEEEELAVSDLSTLVEKGIVQVDPELEEAIRRKYKLPAHTPTDPSQTSPPAPTPPVEAKAGERRRRTAVAASTSLSLPERDLRRQPYEQEVAASVDYALMDAQMQTLVDKLVADVSTLQAAQITELAASIEAAEGDLVGISDIAASPVFKDTIDEAMQTMATQGVEQAIGEAARQGVTVPVPELETATLTSRAEAVDTLLTRSLSEAAGRKALALTGGSLSASEVASQTGEYLSGLTDDYLRQQLGGTLVQAMNTGRKAVFAAHPPKALYASELLDESACEECVAIDGTEYDSLEEAEADYPTGGYSECLGGPRCRGTLVAVHTDEAAPST